MADGTARPSQCKSSLLHPSPPAWYRAERHEGVGSLQLLASVSAPFTSVVYIRKGRNKYMYNVHCTVSTSKLCCILLWTSKNASQMYPLQITVHLLSIKWSSFYVLGSEYQRCNFYGQYIYAPSITKTERKAYLKNRTNIILRLACHGEN